MKRTSPVRTDLAVEICEDAMKNKSSLSGIEYEKEEKKQLTFERVRITSPEGEALSGKPQGEYLTVTTGKIWMEERGKLREKVYEFRDELMKMIDRLSPERSSVLVAGLGNSSITADSIGPETVKNLIVTRHIRTFSPLMFEELGLFDTCAISPGVLAQTGIESADIIKSVVEKIKPGMLLVVDALASRKLSRLVTTVQLADSGILPGSGVGNTRNEITESSMGVPVLSIGVPTVVDAATLACDAIEAFSEKEADFEAIQKKLSQNELNFFVTPKETDEIISLMSSFIGYAINLSLNPDMSFEDMLSLIG